MRERLDAWREGREPQALAVGEIPGIRQRHSGIVGDLRDPERVRERGDRGRCHEEKGPLRRRHPRLH